MKNIKRVLSVLLLSLFIGNFAFASFPYTKATDVKTTTITKDSTNKGVIVADQTTYQQPKSITNDNSSEIDDDLLITILLWVFLGFLAGHRWYKKKPVGWNILFILTGGGCGVWAIVDLVNILTGNF